MKYKVFAVIGLTMFSLGVFLMPKEVAGPLQCMLWGIGFLALFVHRNKVDEDEAKRDSQGEKGEHD